MDTLTKLLLVLVIMFWPVIGSPWAPPDNPDPGLILDSVNSDRKAGNYSDALEKHLWFHDNALKIDESYYGVRLSFALAYWNELSKLYLPAKSAFEKNLLDAKEKSKEGNYCCVGAFDDYVSMNRTLGRYGDTVEFFTWLEFNKPDVARSYFNLAKPALLRLKHYETIQKYLDPNLEMLKLKRKFDLHMQYAESNADSADLLEFAIKAFTNGTATLVALLVINENADLAESIVDEAILKYDSEHFKTELEEAIQGIVPEPWP